jgi:hypothetical protein
VRLFKDNRGQIRVIEAFFASVLIFSVLALAPASRNNTNTGNQALTSMGQQTLLTLDGNGYLSKLIDNRDWTTLRDCIQSAFPPTVWYNLTVTDEKGNVLNPTSISSGTPVNEQVISLNCVCASQSATYDIYLIRLQLAVVS